MKWKNLDDPEIRTADSVFSDRINCWSRCKELEPQLYGDEAPADMVADYVETSIRLELCFSELRSFNNTGAFIGKHPFITHRTERERIEDLLKTDPAIFLEEFKNIEGNIARYSSLMNSQRLDQAKRQRVADNLSKYKALKEIYREILVNRIHK